MDAKENVKYKNCSLYINYSKCYYKNKYENLKVQYFFLNGINVINILSHVPYFKNKQK